MIRDRQWISAAAAMVLSAASHMDAEYGGGPFARRYRSKSKPVITAAKTKAAQKQKAAKAARKRQRSVK